MLEPAPLQTYTCCCSLWCLFVAQLYRHYRSGPYVLQPLPTALATGLPAELWPGVIQKQYTVASC